MSTRDDRREAIRDLVRAGGVRTQAEIVDALKAKGFKATQATVSRDIADLELQKDGTGVYVLVEDLQLRALGKTAMTDVRRSGNQVVLLCKPGTAPSVAAAIDAARDSDVLGSIAGDDTVLVIATDEEAGSKFLARMEGLMA